MSTAKKKLTTCEPKTAVAYARYSSARQRDVSIEQQLQDIRAYAEREGYKIIYEYADHAKSGFHNVERRTEFQAMLRAADSGTFDTVIAWKVDRFGRNRRESAIFKGQLADHGVKVVYAMEPIPDGAAGVLTEGMLESLAEWYSRNIAENTKRGLMDNARKCYFNGQRTLGYQMGPDHRYMINEPQAAVVRRIFTLYSQGYSFQAIANILNSEGITTVNGIPFRKNSLTHMITNDTYIGVYHYCDVRIPGGVPPIIDRDLWDACQAMRKKTMRHQEKNTMDYYLSGKCFCGRCGARLDGNYGTGRGKRYYYYICSARHKDKTKCDAPNTPKDKIEKDIFDFIFSQVLDGPLMDNFVNSVADVLAASIAESPVEKLRSDLNDTNRRIDNINKAISEGIWTRQTAAMLSDLTEKADILQQKIAYHQMTDGKAVSKDRIRFMMHKIAEGRRDDPAYLKSVASILINSITVYDHQLRVVVNAAENVSQIPQEDLPPVDDLPDGSCLALRPTGVPRLVTVEPYPVIVFKIAI